MGFIQALNKDTFVDSKRASFSAEKYRYQNLLKSNDTQIKIL